MAHHRVQATDNPHLTSSPKQWHLSDGKKKTFQTARTSLILLREHVANAFPTPTSPKSTEKPDLHDFFVLLLKSQPARSLERRYFIYTTKASILPTLLDATTTLLSVTMYRINVPSKEPSLKMQAIA